MHVPKVLKPGFSRSDVECPGVTSLAANREMLPRLEVFLSDPCGLDEGQRFAVRLAGHLPKDLREVVGRHDEGNHGDRWPCLGGQRLPMLLQDDPNGLMVFGELSRPFAHIG
jgi:hypothetical protein